MPLLAVNHHYFREKGPGRGIYPTSSARLMHQVRVLSKGWRMASERDLLTFCDAKLSVDDYACVITFDDGLKEQMRALFLLSELKIGAICYVPTAPIVDQIVLDVHKLHMIRSVRCDEELAEHLSRRFDFSSYAFDDELLAVQYRYDSMISRRVKYYLNFVLQKDIRDCWVSGLFEELFGSEKHASEQLYMDKNDLRQLAKCQRLGTHSHRHLPLATLSVKEMESEISNSIDVLQQLTGRHVLGISYPYGGKSAVSSELFLVAKKCGLKYGFTMERGINGAHDIHPFLLRRIDTNDVEDWCGQR